MDNYRRVERSSTPGLSVQCAECGRMLAYDRAFVRQTEAFRFYHEECARAREGR